MIYLVTFAISGFLFFFAGKCRGVLEVMLVTSGLFVPCIKAGIRGFNFSTEVMLHGIWTFQSAYHSQAKGVGSRRIPDNGVQWRLFRRDMLGSNPSPKGLYYEDLASTCRIICGVEEAAVLDCCNLYAYRLRSDSFIRQKYRHIDAVPALHISVRLYSAMCRWYSDLTDAAASRCFSLCRTVFARVPTAHGSTEENRTFFLL